MNEELLALLSGANPPNLSDEDFDFQGFQGLPEYNIIQGFLGDLLGNLTGSLTGLTSLDALLQQQAARTDPTLPALANVQMAQLANLMGGGGFDFNAAVSGQDPTQGLQGVSFGGDASNPLNLPAQSPNQQSVISPSMVQMLQGMFGGVGDFATTTFLGQILGSPFYDTSSFSGDNLQLILDALGGGGGGGSFAAPPSLGTGSNIPIPQGAQGPSFQAPPPKPQSFTSSNQALDTIFQPPQQFAQQRAREDEQPLASYQTGTPFVPQTGTYQLHRGEAVIPSGAIDPRQEIPQGQYQRPTGQQVTPLASPRTLAPAPTGSPISSALPTAPASAGPVPLSSSMVAPPPANISTEIGGGPTRPPEGTSPTPQTFDPVGPPPGGFTGPQGAAQGAPGTNPLSESINALMQLLQGGGPYTDDIVHNMLMGSADTIQSQTQNAMQGIQDDFASRGLNNSGALEALQLQAQLGGNASLVNAQNQIAQQQALGNFTGNLQTANALNNAALGAGQFGLQQNAMNFAQQQQLLQSILQTLLRTAPGTINVSGGGATGLPTPA